MKKWFAKQKQNIKKGSLLAAIGLGLATTPSVSYAKQMNLHEQAIQPMTLHVQADNLRVRSSPTTKEANIITTISQQDIYAVAQVENEGILWFKVYIEKKGKRSFAYIAARDGNTWFVSQKKALPKQPDLNLAEYCTFTAQWESSGLDNYSKEAYIDPTEDMKKYIRLYGNSLVDPSILQERLNKLGINKKKVHYSIGYGTLLDNKIALHKRLKQLGLDKHELIAGRQHMTKEQAYYLLEEEIKESLYIAKKYVNTFDRLPIDARLIIVDMVYNMGEDTFKGFENTIRAFNEFDFVSAAFEMKDSKWFAQVKNRAEHHNAKIIKLAQYVQTPKAKSSHPFG